MKKLILIIGLLTTTTLTFSQNINSEKSGYTDIFNVDSTNQTNIYQKLKEWIGINYNSANDVIQLDSNDKIIVKGNFVLPYVVEKIAYKYRISNSLIFSIKDNRFKTDLFLTDIKSVDFPDALTDNAIYEMFITDEVMSKDEYRIYSLKLAEKTYIKMGFNKQKIDKMLSQTDKYIDSSYVSYQINKENFDKYIESLFISIKNSVIKKDDW